MRGQLLLALGWLTTFAYAQYSGSGQTTGCLACEIKRALGGVLPGGFGALTGYETALGSLMAPASNPTYTPDTYGGVNYANQPLTVAYVASPFESSFSALPGLSPPATIAPASSTSLPVEKQQRAASPYASAPSQSLADAQASPNFNIVDYGQSIGVELGKNIGTRVARLPQGAQVIGIRQPNGEITRFSQQGAGTPPGGPQTSPGKPLPLPTEPNPRDLGALLKALIRNNRNNRGNGGPRNNGYNNNNNRNGNFHNLGTWNGGGWNNGGGNCC